MTTSLPNLQLLRRYLTADGWTAEALEIDGLDAFVHDEPGVGAFELVLPVESAFAGADQHMEQALRTLAGLKRKTPAEIAEDVRGIGFDRIDAALRGSIQFRDSIPLRVADTFLRQAHSLVVSTAVAEFEASAVDEPGPAADQYGDECRFAHTFHGSFGFRILSYVGPHKEHELSNQDSPPPPSRRIVQRLSRGLGNVGMALAAGDTLPLVRDARRGLNAEGCFALARLLDGSETDAVSFDFAFSPEWQLPAGDEARPSIELRSTAVSLIREAGRELRVRPSERPQPIRGRVVRLVSEHDPGDLFHTGGREIGVRWSSDDFGRVNVRFHLSAQGYDEAIEAHRRGRDVQVVGIVERDARGTFRIARVVDFRTL